MIRVLVEQQVGVAPWRWLGAISPSDQPGSITDHAYGKRQVVVFGWRDGRPGVWLSLAGLDVETGPDRVVHSAGWETLADLNDGPHERLIVTAMGIRSRMRWSLTD
jgi:hypothetical protein